MTKFFGDRIEILTRGKYPARPLQQDPGSNYRFIPTRRMGRIHVCAFATGTDSLRR
jgi:hypothetical protein